MWKRNDIEGVGYVNSPKKGPINEASKYARTMIKSKVDKYDQDIVKDYNKVLNDGAFYLPNFFEKTDEREIFNKLKEEINADTTCERVEWSKHFKYENPTHLKTVNDIVEKMATHFDITVLHCRLNYYMDETSYKPLHKDQNAYSSIKGDFTAGASFGDTRALQFVHDKSGMKFEFPQNNGDVFSFNQEVNQAYMHGVPKTKKKVGERFSIIAWGKKN